MPFKDPEQKRAYRKRLYAQDPQGNVEKTSQWRLAHPGRRNTSTRGHYAENPEGYQRRNKKYHQAHPEMQRAANRRRYARKRGAIVSDFTAAQWQEMRVAYDFRCVYCRRKMQRLTQDHLTPLIQGGSHTKANIVPACQSCNAKKGTGLVLIPVQPLLL